MSKLSNFLNNAGAWLESVVTHASPDQKTVIANTAQSMKGAASAIEAGLPVLAEAAADMLLLQVGGGQYIPSMNEFIDLVSAALQKRKTPAPVAPAA